MAYTQSQIDINHDTHTVVCISSDDNVQDQQPKDDSDKEKPAASNDQAMETEPAGQGWAWFIDTMWSHTDIVYLFVLCVVETSGSQPPDDVTDKTGDEMKQSDKAGDAPEGQWS